MKTILLITSILALHYPAGLIRDTQRRYDNMKRQGNTFDYDEINGTSIYEDKTIFNLPYALVALIAGAIIPILPIMEFDFSWFVAIIINIILYVFLGPVLAFISTPMMQIHNKYSIKIRVKTYIIIGLLLYFISKFLL